MIDEAADVAFIEGVDVKLVIDTAGDPTSCVVNESISLEKEWVSVEVPTWEDWLTLAEGKVMIEDGSMLVLEV